MRRHRLRHVCLLLLALVVVAATPSLIRLTDGPRSPLLLEPFKPGSGWNGLVVGQASLKDAIALTGSRNVEGTYHTVGLHAFWVASVDAPDIGVKILVLDPSGASPTSGDYFRDTVDSFRGKLHSVSIVPSRNRGLARTDKGLSLFDSEQEMKNLYGPPDAQWNPRGVEPRYSTLNYYTLGLLVGIGLNR